MTMPRLRRRTTLLLFTVLCVGALFLTGALPGISGPPEPQERPVFINFTNTANTSHTLELWTGEGTELDGIRVHRSTGGDYNTTEGTAGISSHYPGDYHTVTFLSFPEGVQLYGRYTLEPGATRTWTMAEPYGQTVFVVVVYTDDHVKIWKSVSCDNGVLSGFKVQVTSYGAPGAFSCL